MIYPYLLDLLSQKKELNEKIEAVKQELASKMFTYKVGEITTPKGFAHEDKKCRITSINICFDYDGKLDIHVAGTVLKKDGTDSAHTVKWASWNDQNLKLELERLVKL